MHLPKALRATACAAASVLLMLMPLRADPLPGDADGNGVVDFTDYQTLEANFGQGGAWAQGDFNGDGRVGFADYQIMEANYGSCFFSVNVTVQNNTGAAKTNWPVFLTAWKVFGPDLPVAMMKPDGFHVYNSGGTELARMVRTIPPDFSVGNREIVFLIPQIAASETQTYRVTNTPTPGLTQTIDLLGNANNLLPNGGFENDSGGVPTGYTVTSSSGGAGVAYDTTVKRSGGKSLRMTLPVGSTLTLKTASNISFTAGRNYHFSIWAKSENVAYNGYGFYNRGGTISFDSQAFTTAAEGGRATRTLKGDRDWYCYRFDSGSNDSWGVPVQGSVGKSTQSTRFNLTGDQLSQPFLHGDKTGKMWFDDAMLFEQPTVTVDRKTPLEALAKSGVVIFGRPVQMPRYGPCAHENITRLTTYGLRGERREIRFGIYAVSALSNVEVVVSSLTGPGGGQISGGNLDLELLNDYVQQYGSLLSLGAGSIQEYMLGIEVPEEAPAGTYTGTASINAGGGTIRTLPIEVEVLPLSVPSMAGYYLGGIYNIGFPLDRNDDFYRCYGKVRFTYLMLFDYFCTRVNQMGMDFPLAQTQVDKLASLAHVTTGIGLYREPNMSEDQPRMFYQMATGDPVYPGKYKGTDPAYKTGYQDYCQQLEEYALAHNWPRMVSMVSDEPDRAADKVDYMGWLNNRLPNALTCCDAQFADMIATWNWYNIPIIDDPADWSGPFIYDYIRTNKSRFGFCGPAIGLESGRYQPGLMIASSGAMYWHWWHTQGPFNNNSGKVERMHHVAAMGAGMGDIRYYVLLKQLIAANQTGPKAAIAAEASNWLAGALAYPNADHDRHLLPYNGTPTTWGYDRWYDEWQTTMKEYCLQLGT